MPNPAKKNKWLFEDRSEFYNHVFKYIQKSSRLIEGSTKISDSASMTPSSMTLSDICAFPIETSFCSPIRHDPQELMGFLPPDNPSTELSVTDETVINPESIERHKKQFAGTLIQLIHEEIFEYGMENAADEFLQINLCRNPLWTKDWLNTIFLENFSDVKITTGILRIISHLEYADIYPTGQMIAMGALSHKIAEVREIAIRAFENWESVESLGYLRHVQCGEKWLQSYLEQVINELEEYNVFIS